MKSITLILFQYYCPLTRPVKFRATIKIDKEKPVDNTSKTEPYIHPNPEREALLARVKEQAGWVLGKDASLDLYALYRKPTDGAQKNRRLHCTGRAGDANARTRERINPKKEPARQRGTGNPPHLAR